MHNTAMSESYELFHYDSCPFCAMVRRFLDAKGVSIPLRNTQREQGAQAELVAGGGRSMVPCLKITSAAGDVRWMYESADIMRYLDGKLSSGEWAPAQQS